MSAVVVDEGTVTVKGGVSFVEEMVTFELVTTDSLVDVISIVKAGPARTALVEEEDVSFVVVVVIEEVRAASPRELSASSQLMSLVVDDSAALVDLVDLELVAALVDVEVGAALVVVEDDAAEVGAEVVAAVVVFVAFAPFSCNGPSSSEEDDNVPPLSSWGSGICSKV